MLLTRRLIPGSVLHQRRQNQIMRHWGVQLLCLLRPCHRPSWRSRQVYNFCVCNEHNISSCLQRFLQQTGGRQGGWDDYDHKVFLRTRTNYGRVRLVLISQARRILWPEEIMSGESCQVSDC